VKAITYQQYGSVEVMQLSEVPMPKIQADELLVKIQAASVNPVDWKIRNGEMKIMTGKNFPKGMGFDFAGMVEEVGGSVSGFKKGDAVFGWIPYKMANAFGEYAVVKANLTVNKPANISFQEAACLPMAGVAALKALTGKGALQQGQEVLINGCTGGVGLLAVQIAKAYNAKVTGTCSPGALEVAKNIGVDTVIDFTKQNILDYGKHFDIILDTSGKLPYAKAKAILTASGKFLDLNFTPLGMLKSLISSQYKAIITSVRKQDLEQLAKFATDGNIKPYIGKTFALAEAIEAIKSLEQGGKVTGKAVLSI
jgi:NADPH:quinone reductase-like Zn-dependent oxidoreductase